MNSTWYPEIEEPIKSCEKHYSLVLYILKQAIALCVRQVANQRIPAHGFILASRSRAFHQILCENKTSPPNEQRRDFRDSVEVNVQVEFSSVSTWLSRLYSGKQVDDTEIFPKQKANRTDTLKGESAPELSASGREVWGCVPAMVALTLVDLDNFTASSLDGEVSSDDELLREVQNSVKTTKSPKRSVDVQLAQLTCFRVNSLDKIRRRFAFWLVIICRNGPKCPCCVAR